jgi:hypothetical protein
VLGIKDEMSMAKKTALDDGRRKLENPRSSLHVTRRWYSRCMTKRSALNAPFAEQVFLSPFFYFPKRFKKHKEIHRYITSSTLFR